MKIAIFTGPRQITREDEQLVRAVAREVISRGFQIYVGDATGVDFIAACAALDSDTGYIKGKIFAPRPDLGRTPAGLAERSTRMVKEASAEALQFGSLQCGEILCIGFPNKPCPYGIIPARSWRSGGSGTWSTLALSIGHEIETWIIPIGNLCRKTYQAPWSLDWRIETLFDCAAGLHFTQAPSLFAQEVLS